MKIEKTNAIAMKVTSISVLRGRINQLHEDLRTAILSNAGLSIGDQVSYVASHAGREVAARGEVVGAGCSDDSDPHLLVRRMRKDGTLSKLHDTVTVFEKVKPEGDANE